MSLIKAEPGDVVALTYVERTRTTTLYPKAYIYDISGNEITTVSLSHIANGFYSGQYTTTGAYKLLTIITIPYTDVARTIEAEYDSAEDRLYVGYDYKAPGFGAVEREAKLSEKDKKDLIDEIVKKINLDNLFEEIRKKSEFDPTRDKVKTDIKVPSFNLRETNETLSQIKKALSPTKDYNANFQKLERLIKDSGSSKFETKTILGLLKNLNRNPEIKVNMGRVEKMLESIDAMMEAFNGEEFKRNQKILNELSQLKRLFTSLIAIVSSEQQKKNERFEELFDTMESLNEKKQ